MRHGWRDHRCRWDANGQAGWLLAEKQEEQLRALVDTVGKRGKPGQQLQNVISVAMLSEGWDAANVTHIMGLRAFTSQLLCEQVIGRGLRRVAYERDENGLFSAGIRQRLRRAVVDFSGCWRRRRGTAPAEAQRSGRSRAGPQSIRDPLAECAAGGDGAEAHPSHGLGRRRAPETRSRRNAAECRGGSVVDRICRSFEGQRNRPGEGDRGISIAALMFRAARKLYLQNAGAFGATTVSRRAAHPYRGAVSRKR